MLWNRDHLSATPHDGKPAAPPLPPSRRETRPDWAPCAAVRVFDVIRWTEPVFAAANDAPPAVIGRRAVTAQVLDTAAQLSLRVLSQEWIGVRGAALPLQPGDRLQRPAALVLSGGCRRLTR
jgi:hypothetical protein